MKEIAREHAAKAAPYANVALVEGFLYFLDERYHLALTRTNFMFLGPAIAIAARYLWLGAKPILKALQRWIVRRLGSSTQDLLIVIVVCWGVMSAGCYGAYKAAVELYASGLPARGAVYYDLVVPELQRELIRNDASLICLVDEDTGKLPSNACECAKGLPSDWPTPCAAYLGGLR